MSWGGPKTGDRIPRSLVNRQFTEFPQPPDLLLPHRPELAVFWWFAISDSLEQAAR